ncbi:MAG TPA: ribonuclease HII [Candidatus Nanopelagicaceae bacterium]
MKIIEQILLDAGLAPIAGVDEAGRGACAGPLLVAAVILRDPFAPELSLLRDSKELSARIREELYEIIAQQSLAISLVEISSEEVDERGVHIANLEGMRRAVQGLSTIPGFVLTDGYAIPGLGLPTLGVWKGDQVVASISAASIVAKVSRDRLMREADLEFPEYGFARHKGYGTASHSAALAVNGPCRIHRRSFSNVAALINTDS